MRIVRRLSSAAVLLAVVLLAGCDGNGAATNGKGDCGSARDTTTPDNQTELDGATDAATPANGGVTLSVVTNDEQVLGTLTAFDRRGVWLTAAGEEESQFLWWQGCGRQTYLSFPTSDCSGERAIQQVVPGGFDGVPTAGAMVYNRPAGTRCTPVPGETDEFLTLSFLEPRDGHGTPCAQLECVLSSAPSTHTGSAWRCIPAPDPGEPPDHGELRVVVEQR